MSPRIDDESQWRKQKWKLVYSVRPHGAEASEWSVVVEASSRAEAVALSRGFIVRMANRPDAFEPMDFLRAVEVCPRCERPLAGD